MDYKKIVVVFIVVFFVFVLVLVVVSSKFMYCVDCVYVCVDIWFG